MEDLRSTTLEKDCQQIRICIEMGLNCVQFDETKRPTAKEIINSLKMQDDPILHGINEEKLPTDEVGSCLQKTYGARVCVHTRLFYYFVTLMCILIKFQLIQVLQNCSSESKPGIYPLTMPQLTLNAESPRQNTYVNTVVWNSIIVERPSPDILPSNVNRCLIFALADLTFHNHNCSWSITNCK